MTQMLYLDNPFPAVPVEIRLITSTLFNFSQKKKMFPKGVGYVQSIMPTLTTSYVCEKHNS